MKRYLFFFALMLVGMTASLSNVKAMAADRSSGESEYVPLVREGVEWGYSRSVTVASGNIGFFRLQFDGETEINGKVYSNLYMYDSYFIFTDGVSPIAWMREEDKKVYAILNPEFSETADEYGCLLYDKAEGDEVLLMDYSVGQNESFTIGNDKKSYEALCTKIEPIQLGTSVRNKFTIELKSYEGPGSATFEMMEGVGPVSETFPGDGSFIFPFCVPLTGLTYPQPYDGWLYEREVLPVDTSYGDPDLYIYKMGNITLKSPIFDYCGVHDPTVWYWMEKNGTFTGVDTVAEPDNLEMMVSEGIVSVTSPGLSKLMICRPDGILVDIIPAADGKASFSFGNYGERMLIISAILADGRKMVRKIVAR